MTVPSEWGRSAAPALPASHPCSRGRRGRDAPSSSVPEAKVSCHLAGTAPCRLVEALPRAGATADPNPCPRGRVRATTRPQPYWELWQPPAATCTGATRVVQHSSEVPFATGHQDRAQVTPGMEGAEPTLGTTVGSHCPGGVTVPKGRAAPHVQLGCATATWLCSPWHGWTR